MGRTQIRLLIAASMSASCFGLTHWWYTATSPDQSAHSNQKPLAFIEKTKDEILRKPVSRTIWQEVNEGDAVYNNEAIRTSSLGEVRVTFAEGGRHLDLEPDSLIMISQNNNEISLDLMDGSFVVAKAEGTSTAGGPTLTLNSGGGKVDLSNATASLSKGSGGIDLQVLKGKATVESADGKSQDIESGKSGVFGSQGVSFKQENLQILSPSTEIPTYVNPELVAPTLFKWKGFPANSVVSIHTGTSRKSLASKVETETSESTLQLSPGKYFWKLSAKDKTTQKLLGESSIYTLEVASRIAPTVVFPMEGSAAQKKTPEDAIEFRWVKPEAARLVTIEIWSDPSLKQKIFNKTLSKEETWNIPLKDGEYLWRVSASYPQIEKPILGKIVKFKVRPYVPPKPPVVIGWVNPEEKTQFFVTQPATLWNWQSEQKDQVKSWKLYLAETEEDFTHKKYQTYETKDLVYKAPVVKAGRYVAMVEAVGEDSKVLAKSNFKSIELSVTPLLDAPSFKPAAGDLQADNQGNLTLEWSTIEKAQDYELILFDRKGQALRTAKFKKNTTALKNLLPGTYKVQITAIDEFGRLGNKSEPRPVQVPDTSNLNAPKLKKIKVN